MRKRGGSSDDCHLASTPLLLCQAHPVLLLDLFILGALLPGKTLQKHLPSKRCEIRSVDATPRAVLDF